MSYKALSKAANQTGLRPLEKLLLIQLAHSHHGKTGDCTPSIARLTITTGMNREQVMRLIRSLEDRGYISALPEEIGFILNFLDDDMIRVPENWWPSDEAIQSLVDAYPNHNFIPSEAVHDFIRFARETERTYAPGDLDNAFVRNISAFLDRKPAGRVEFAISRDAGAQGSVGAYLAQMP